MTLKRQKHGKNIINLLLCFCMYFSLMNCTCDECIKDAKTARCFACKRGISVEDFCKKFPETFSCRYPTAKPCFNLENNNNNNNNTKCEPNFSCKMGICIPNDAHNVPEANTVLLESSTCCDQKDLAVCQSCKHETDSILHGECKSDDSGESIHPQKSKIGCPVCSCSGSCTVSVTPKGTLESTCLGTPPQINCNVDIDRCSSRHCTKVFENEQWVCKSMSQFCQKCREEDGACAKVDGETWCVAHDEHPWVGCPAKRRCHGSDMNNVASHFCCEEDEVCEMTTQYGGLHAIFGGKCRKSFDLCQYKNCGNHHRCKIHNNQALCVPDHNQAAHHCANNTTLVTTLSGTHYCSAFDSQLPSTPCGMQCVEGEFCHVSVVGGMRREVCKKLEGQVQCAAEYAFKTKHQCRAPCERDARGQPICTSRSPRAQTVWPPKNVKTCLVHDDCPTHEYCTAFLKQPVAVEPITAWLNAGIKVCEPELFKCNRTEKSTWSTEQLQYCCSKRGIGCSSYQCYNLAETWSEDKQAYCCEHAKIGCNIDNKDLFCFFPAHDWSFEQKEYCCERHNIMCGSTKEVFNCFEDVDMPWGKRKMQHCCEVEGIGCLIEDDYVDCEGKREDELSAAEKEKCCVKYNKFCLKNCTDDKDSSKDKQQFCCDTFSIDCLPTLSLTDCINSITTPHKKCCEMHQIGCEFDCTSHKPHNLHHSNQCCITSGLHCKKSVHNNNINNNHYISSQNESFISPNKNENYQDYANTTNLNSENSENNNENNNNNNNNNNNDNNDNDEISKKQNATKVSVIIKGAWEKVKYNPRSYADRLRTVFASCSPEFGGNINKIKVGCISVNEKGTSCDVENNDFLMDESWSMAFEKKWVQDSATNFYLQARGPFLHPLYHFNDNLRIDLFIANETYLTYLNDCFLNNRFMTTYRGTSLPALLKTDNNNNNNNNQVFFGKEVSFMHVTNMKKLQENVLLSKKKGSDSRLEFLYIFIIIGLLLGGSVPVYCFVTKRQDHQTKLEQPLLSIEELRSLQVGSNVLQAHGDHLKQITKDHMHWNVVDDIGECTYNNGDSFSDGTTGIGLLNYTKMTDHSTGPVDSRLSLEMLQQLQAVQSHKPSLSVYLEACQIPPS